MEVWLWVSFQRLRYDSLHVHEFGTRELTIIISDLLECQLTKEPDNELTCIKFMSRA